MCAAAWSSAATYVAGDEVSENGLQYVANYYTIGSDPATDSGGVGSGEPWTIRATCGSAPLPPPPGGFVFSPYKDESINLNTANDVMQTDVSGTLLPLVGPGSFVSAVESGLKTVTLAFATGTCGSETWNGVSASAFASANIAALNAAGENYVISTGGALGTFACASDSGMSTFINTYLSSHLVGIDFDIEGNQTAAQVQALVNEVAYAETQFPQLRFSSTLATLAASNGSNAGINELGYSVLDAILNAHLTHYTINLMAMDFGGASSSACVVSNGTCEMGQSAIQAVENLETTYGVPASQIAVTVMIGQNDSSGLAFTPVDVNTLMTYAVANGLAGVHFWSLDRDTSCAAGPASPTCNSVPTTTPLEYTNAFLEGAH